jgi:N-formylmaleamate deformylase
MMLKYSEDDVNIRGVKIHYYRCPGKKGPVVLLHGATDNGLCWVPIAEWLVARQYGVIMPDAHGHGLSDRLTPDFSFKDHADQFAGLIQKLGIEKPILIGHSMGGVSAVNLAVHYPDLPAAVVLEDPAWLPPDAGLETPEIKKQRSEMMQSMATMRTKTPSEGLIEGHRINPKWSEGELIPWARAKTQFDPDLFKYLNLSNYGYAELVPKMDCPTLLMTADRGIVSVETAKQVQKIWHSVHPFRWVQIIDSGHNIRREQFSRFTEVLEYFLAGLSET